MKGERSLRGFEKGTESHNHESSEKHMTNKKKKPEPATDNSRQVHVVCMEGEDPQLEICHA